MTALFRAFHWLRGCYGRPDAEGQVYCTRCERFLYG